MHQIRDGAFGFVGDVGGAVGADGHSDWGVSEQPRDSPRQAGLDSAQRGDVAKDWRQVPTSFAEMPEGRIPPTYSDCQSSRRARTEAGQCLLGWTSALVRCAA